MSAFTAHGVALMLVTYLALADNAMRRVLQRLLREPDSERVVDAASDWAFRAAATTLSVELAMAFFELHNFVGMLLAVIGALLLFGSIGIPVGDIFRKRVGPLWLFKRPTFGRLIQVWLLGTFTFLGAVILRGTNATH